MDTCNTKFLQFKFLAQSDAAQIYMLVTATLCITKENFPSDIIVRLRFCIFN